MKTHTQLIDVWESSSASVAIVVLALHYGEISAIGDPARLGLWWGALLFPVAQALVRWVKRWYDLTMDGKGTGGGTTVALFFALMMLCGACAGVTYTADRSASVDITRGPPCVICVAVDDDPCKVKITAPTACKVLNE